MLVEPSGKLDTLFDQCDQIAEHLVAVVKTDVHSGIVVPLHRPRALEADPREVVRPEIARLGQVRMRPAHTLLQADLLQVTVKHRAVHESE